MIILVMPAPGVNARGHDTDATVRGNPCQPHRAPHRLGASPFLRKSDFNAPGLPALDTESPASGSYIMKLAVGVDVVDLQDPRARDRSGDTRFMGRVFSPSERERILSAADPALELWVLWGAKEAAFKVVSKLLGAPPTFQHNAFRVLDPPGVVASRLAYEGLAVQLGLDVHPQRVMVWAWNGPSPEILVAQCRVPDALHSLELSAQVDEWRTDRFNPREMEAVRGLPSALVRLMARRDAARMLRTPETRLAITCPPGFTGLRPPYLERDGKLMEEADISLSHDGTQLAWAIRVS